MADYIERQAAIKELCETYEHEYPTASGAFDEYATRIVPNVLRNLPPADVRPVVRGKWIKLAERSGWCCSVCKKDDLYAYRYGADNERELQDFFCPNCGAQMGGDAE